MIELITKLAEADFKGAAEIAGQAVSNNLNSAGSLVMGGIDAILPGSPAAYVNDLMKGNTNTPTKAVQDRTSRINEDVPAVPTGMPTITFGETHISVSGVNDPKQIANEVDKAIQDKLRQTKVGLGEGRK